jgi:hypothetical protein
MLVYLSVLPSLSFLPVALSVLLGASCAAALAMLAASVAGDLFDPRFRRAQLVPVWIRRRSGRD